MNDPSRLHAIAYKGERLASRKLAQRTNITLNAALLATLKQVAGLKGLSLLVTERLLVQAAEDARLVARGEVRPQFVRLMRLLDVPVQVAEQVAAGATDWIDSDQDQQPMGAEDGAYLGRDPAYRTAGTLMSDPSELRAIAGMTPEIYARIRPWICTLPFARPSPINVNTLLPEQSVLLAMMYPDTLSVGGAQQLLLRRPVQGYATFDELQKGASLLGAANIAPGVKADVLSTWFTLDIDVTLGTTQMQERALIDANRLPAQLVSRQWGEPS